MSLKTTVTAAVGALIGGAVVWLGQKGSFNLVPVGMSYPDLAATLLAAVGTIVAIFGGVLALAALWGFSQLKRDAISAATTAGVAEIQAQVVQGAIRDHIVSAASAAGAAELKEQIENGSIRDYIRAEVERLADEEFNSDRMDDRINRRVDAVALGRAAADRLLDEGEDGEP